MLCGLASAVSAAQPCTNTWANAQGHDVTNLFGVADNWQVKYAPGATPPPSAVPTRDSWTSMLKDATIALEQGEERHLGETFFLGEGTYFKTLDFVIPSGASLSLDGTGLSSHMGTSSWCELGTRNYATIDVNGGSLTLGQSVFSMRGNTKKAYDRVPVNRLVVRNGGTLSVTNGYVRLWGGSASDSAGLGCYTNIIDVTDGSTLKLSNNGRIAFGSSHHSSQGDYNTPWTENYYGSGWVNVKGGRLVVENGSTWWPIVIHGANMADMPACLNVTDGGVADLGGKAIYFGSASTGIVNVARGGVLTNCTLSVQDGKASSARNNMMIDVNGGTVYADDFSFGTSSGKNTGRITVRSHGSDSTFDVGRFLIHSGYGPSSLPVYFDMRLAPHTDRTADFAIKPIRTRTYVYNGAGENAYVQGYWRLSPDGGFQIVHKGTFELLCRSHDSQGDYKFSNDRYGGLVGSEMWQTNVGYRMEQRWEKYTGYKYAYLFSVSLKDDAKLTDGVPLSVPKPRAWLQLPQCAKREVDPKRMVRVSVRLGLVAPEGGSLDIAEVVRKMREEGEQDAYADDGVEGYNVRVDLPLNELKADTADDRVVMDFVTCDSYAHVSGVAPMVTNALIRVAACEKVKKEIGMRLILK